MASDDKINTLNFENNSGVLLHPNNWMSEGNYEDENENWDKNINENEKNAHEYYI